MKTVDSTTAYVYDGSGARVRKLVGENTRFVYGLDGELIMEFDGSNGNLKKEYVSSGITIEPTGVNSNGTRYSTADNLGSPRVITNSSASVVSRHDFMPFGEELSAGVGGRTTGMGFSVTDGQRKKFTGYEADAETGLNFAEARYQSATAGRFTSPDPFSGSMSTADPQSFNRYAYVGNNPVNAIDPSGMTMINSTGAPTIPGALGALGRVHPGYCPPTEWVGDPSQHWTMAGGGQQQPPSAPPPSTQPPPVDVPSGQYFAEGSIDWENGPRPLLYGEEPVPTNFIPLEGPSQIYNGNSEISPTGTVVDGGRNYGQAKVVDYLILDQGGNPMGPKTRVSWTESLRSPDSEIQTKIENGTIKPSTNVPPQQNGTVHDTLGFISHDPATSQTAATTRPFVVIQGVTISMPNANNRPQGVLYRQNTISISPSGVAIQFGPQRHR